WATHQQFLSDWQAQLDRLEADLARQIPEIETQRRLRAVSRQALAAALPARSVLIEFVRCRIYDFTTLFTDDESPPEQARYLAFVLPAGEPERVTLIDLGDAGSLDRLIVEFRGHVQRGSVGPAPDAVGRALRAAVFDRAAEQFGGRRRLV